MSDELPLSDITSQSVVDNNNKNCDIDSNNNVIVELSLNKAQKVLAKMKELVKQYDIFAKSQYSDYLSSKPKTVSCNGIVSVSYNSSNPVSNFEQFNENIKTIMKSERKKIETFLCLSHDLRKCKDALFSANVVSGLHEVLSQIEMLEKEKTVFSSLRKNVSSYDKSSITNDVNQAYFNGIASVIREGSTITSFTVNCLLYSEEILDNKLSSIASTLNDLEDKRDKINALSKVKFNMSRETRSLLGLN